MYKRDLLLLGITYKKCSIVGTVNIFFKLTIMFIKIDFDFYNNITILIIKKCTSVAPCDIPLINLHYPQTVESHQIISFFKLHLSSIIC